MKSNELFRASGIMALGTIISRITGFIRGILIVAVLGTTLLADTYNVANTMPNILYNLLVGGALTAIFIPQLVRSFDHEDGGDGFASRLVTTISLILLVLVAIGIYFAPALVRLYAPEFFTVGFETEKEIAIAFTRYCLPQIFFLGVFTMLGQVANARGSFGPLMWAPIANNLVGIAIFGSFLIFSPAVTTDTITPFQVQLLGWGTTFSVVVQALVLIPVIRHLGIKLKPQWGLSGLGKSFGLAGWTLLYVLISQLGYLVTVNVATSAAVRSAQEGLTRGVGYTPYTYAYFVMLLPYSIVTISIITAILPHLSRLAVAKNPDEVRIQLIRAIKLVGVITIPSAVAFLLFGPLITEVIFVGIPVDDSRYIGYVLSALSFGLVAFSINLILIRGFNAFEDTRTQVISIFIINLISVGLSYLFLHLLKVQWVTIGLGLAFSISYLVGLLITLLLLKKHTGPIKIKDFLGQHARLLGAAFGVMTPLYVLIRYITWLGVELSPIARAGELFLVMIMAFLGYLIAGRAVGVEEISMIRHLRESIVRRSSSAE
ncbi:MAG: murein biosynthesis integral membrane protein MurJ [Streptomycetaceae bacterium]|jgi:putative peptidoglycan lipid II flippase|nr:MAG: murein biosynthesis integral membrane protein MurJ [Streptomycetaceae bacterium]